MKNINNLWPICFVVTASLLAPYSNAAPSGANNSIGNSASANAGMEGPPKLQGMWVWSAKYINSAKAREKLLSFSHKFGFNRLLVQVHRKDGKIIDGFRELVISAAKMGIGVEALNGAPAMALGQQRSKAIAHLRQLIKFNDHLPENAKLRGMHYDIEPYSLKAWQDDNKRKQIILELLSFYKYTGILLHYHNLTLACDIPFWYDSHGYKTSFSGQEKPLYKDIIDICDYVGIMSYRYRANKVEAVVENEMQYAATVGKYVCPSLATLEQKKHPNISFYGRGADKLLNAHKQIIKHYSGNPAFGGILYHDYIGVKTILLGNKDIAKNKP